MKRALFLDRDGVVNVDRDYVHRIEDFEWMPGIFDLARLAATRGALLVVVTNQSGISRGYYTEEMFRDLTGWMAERFAAEGAPIAHTYHCPFLTDEDGNTHPLRKPNPGMILAAEEELRLDLAASALIGDKWSDVEAGMTAGIGANAIVGAHASEHAGEQRYTGVTRLADLTAALAWADRVFADA